MSDNTDYAPALTSDREGILEHCVGRMSARLGLCATVADPDYPQHLEIDLDFIFSALDYAIRFTTEQLLATDAVTVSELDNLFDSLESVQPGHHQLPVAENHVLALLKEDPLPSIGALPGGDEYLAQRIVACLCNELEHVSDTREKSRLAALVTFTTASKWLPVLIDPGELDPEEIQCLLDDLRMECAFHYLTQQKNERDGVDVNP